MSHTLSNKEKFLIVICGLPGTGKTTSAKKLSEQLSGYVLIDQNNVRREHGMKRMPKTQDAVLRDIDRRTAYYLRKGKGVIFESGNRYSFRRHQMYGVASSCGARVVTLEIVCSEKMSKKRIKSRVSGDGLLSDPTDVKVYDRLKKLWEDVMIDFKYPGEDHVSYVQFNTETEKLIPKVVQKGMRQFLVVIGKILKENHA